MAGSFLLTPEGSPPVDVGTDVGTESIADNLFRAQTLEARFNLKDVTAFDAIVSRLRR